MFDLANCRSVERSDDPADDLNLMVAPGSLDQEIGR
jgi:hypothetical protein